jgi:hypothetical protein
MLLLLLTGCAATGPREVVDETESGPTVYGQLSMSIDRISAGR